MGSKDDSEAEDTAEQEHETNELVIKNYEELEDYDEGELDSDRATVNQVEFVGGVESESDEQGFKPITLANSTANG